MIISGERKLELLQGALYLLENTESMFICVSIQSIMTNKELQSLSNLNSIQFLKIFGIEHKKKYNLYLATGTISSVWNLTRGQRIELIREAITKLENKTESKKFFLWKWFHFFGARSIE